MDQEKLKGLAIYMGYEIHHLACEERGGLWVGKYESPHEYNPFTNAEQDRELEIKFNITTYRIHDGSGWSCDIAGKGRATGKTPSEARLNAAIAAIKDL